MIGKRSISLEIFRLSRHVCLILEELKINLKSIELNQKLNGEISLLGETIFNFRGHKDSSALLLIDRIKEARNQYRSNCLLRNYIYISKLFNKVF
jgi:hypothetical protein